MNTLDQGMHRLAAILASYLRGEMTHDAAGNAVVIQLADLEEQLHKKPHDASKAELFLRAFWAGEQLREPPQHRTRTDEITYLVACLIGEAEYDENTANAFYEGGASQNDAV